MYIRVKIVTLLFLCVSLLMSGLGQAEPFVKGADQIQPYETEQGRTNTVAPSYQEYAPATSNDRWGSQDKAQDVKQSDADRVASQKVQQHAGKGAGVAQR